MGELGFQEDKLPALPNRNCFWTSASPLVLTTCSPESPKPSFQLQVGVS